MEVRSEPTPISSREPYSVGLQKSPPVHSPTPQTAIPNMRMTFSTDGSSSMYKQVSATSPPHFQGSGAGGGTTAAGVVSPRDGVAQPTGHLPRLSFNSAEQPLKRKRGRPRKYGPDGSMSLAIAPVTPLPTLAPAHTPAPALARAPAPLAHTSPPAAPVHTPAPAAPVHSPAPASPVHTPAPAVPAHTPAAPPAPVSGGFSSSTGMGIHVSPPPGEGVPSVTIMKKPRGRPPGSISVKKRPIAAVGPDRTGFDPHVITVKTGEDVSSKIMSFLQQGSQAVCILSANGAISNVTLRQAATSGGTVTYEGRFEILSLSGSYFLSEIGGQRSRTGGLSISLAGPDGRVLGGGVAGVLTAASPVQLVLGSFNTDERKEQKETDPTPVIRFSQGNLRPSSPPSRGTLSESSGGSGSPFNQTTITYNNGTPQGMPGVQWK